MKSKQHLKQKILFFLIVGAFNVVLGQEGFSNLWGTFAFGPKNSLYIGAYRGFVRYRSK
jgi:hypothetical protein